MNISGSGPKKVFEEIDKFFAGPGSQIFSKMTKNFASTYELEFHQSRNLPKLPEIEL